jgi:hypothetical protein
MRERGNEWVKNEGWYKGMIGRMKDGMNLEYII